MNYRTTVIRAMRFIVDWLCRCFKLIFPKLAPPLRKLTIGQVVIGALVILFFSFTLTREKTNIKIRDEALTILLHAQNPQQLRQGHEKLLNAAEHGDARAMTLVGLHHLTGEYGAEPNNNLSALRIQKAAEMGDGPAMVTLANLKKYGMGTPQDDSQADTWARKGLKWCFSVSHEDGLAAHTLAQAYYEGTWLPKDDIQVYEFAQKAADAGYPEGWTSLGLCQQLGIGTRQNMEMAKKSYQKAASLGSARAMGRIALLMMEIELGASPTLNEVTPELMSHVRELIREGSWRGNSECLTYAAKMVMHSATREDDNREAFLLLNQAAMRNNGEASMMLGDCYRWGKGVIIDFQSAAECYQLAAQKGIAGASAKYQQMLPLAQMTAGARNVNSADVWRSFQQKAASFVSGLQSDLQIPQNEEQKKQAPSSH